jgi:hypothetical protein
MTASLPIVTIPLRIEIDEERAAIDWLIRTMGDSA